MAEAAGEEVKSRIDAMAKRLYEIDGLTERDE